MKSNKKYDGRRRQNSRRAVDFRTIRCGTDDVLEYKKSYGEYIEENPSDTIVHVIVVNVEEYSSIPISFMLYRKFQFHENCPELVYR